MTALTDTPSGRPQRGEYAAYAEAHVAAVSGDDAVAALAAAAHDTLALLAPLHDDAIAGVRYAPDKWTIKDVIGHLVDDERIMSYRALAMARGERLQLLGFDEKLYASHAGAESRPLADLLAEYRLVRDATLALCRSFSPEGWRRLGIANGHVVSARGVAFHIAGHERHHVGMLRELYLPLVK